MLQGRESVAASKIQLLPGEKILLRGSCVRHGFWDAYTDELVLTNMAFVHISRGLFGNYKDTVRYPFDSVSQIVVGEASNGEKQLEVYHPGGQDDFAFQSGNKRVMKVWELAINDQMSDSGSSYDSAYYSDLPDLAEKEKDNEQTERVDENGRGRIVRWQCSEKRAIVRRPFYERGDARSKANREKASILQGGNWNNWGSWSRWRRFAKRLGYARFDGVPTAYGASKDGT